jgi:hypothetical protein
MMEREEAPAAAGGEGQEVAVEEGAGASGNADAAREEDALKDFMSEDEGGGGEAGGGGGGGEGLAGEGEGEGGGGGGEVQGGGAAEDGMGDAGGEANKEAEEKKMFSQLRDQLAGITGPPAGIVGKDAGDMDLVRVVGILEALQNVQDLIEVSDIVLSGSKDDETLSLGMLVRQLRKISDMDVSQKAGLIYETFSEKVRDDWERRQAEMAKKRKRETDKEEKRKAQKEKKSRKANMDAIVSRREMEDEEARKEKAARKQKRKNEAKKANTDASSPSKSKSKEAGKEKKKKKKKVRKAPSSDDEPPSDVEEEEEEEEAVDNSFQEKTDAIEKDVLIMIKELSASGALTAFTMREFKEDLMNKYGHSAETLAERKDWLKRTIVDQVQKASE